MLKGVAHMRVTYNEVYFSCVVPTTFKDIVIVETSNFK